VKHYIYILLLIFSNNLIANDTIPGIYGTISNEQKAPLAGLNIYLMDSSAQNILAQSISDANGFYGFDIPIKGTYCVVFIKSPKEYQSLTDVAIDSISLNCNVQFTQNYKYSGKKFNSSSAREIEKMPVNNVQQQLVSKGMIDKDANGHLRSRTLGNDVKVIVDGQVLNNSNVELVPGSVGDIEVIER
jgi:hypothetical protein